MKQTFILVLTLVLTGAGCSRQSEAPQSNQPITADNARLARPSAQTSCLNRYFPTTEGQSITYKTVFAGKNDSFTQRIKEVRADGIGIEMSFPAHPGIQLQADYVCDGATIKAKGYADFSSVLTGSKLKMETISSEGVFLPENLEIGTGWSSTFNMKGTMEGFGNRMPSMEMKQKIDVKHKVEKKERITVAAGTYDAVKVKQDTTVTIEILNPTVVIPPQPPVVTSGYIWFVEGLGMVKSESSFNGQSTLVEAETIQMP